MEETTKEKSEQIETLDTEKFKKNAKNLIKWEGFKKELFWIAFFALLFFSAYAYKRDISMCRPYLENPCLKCAEKQDAEIKILQGQVDYLQKEKIEWNTINYSNLKLIP